MTLDKLIEQCVARGLRWQLDGGAKGMNGSPFVTATVYVPDSKPPIVAMRTRSGMPVDAATLALRGALIEVIGRLEVGGNAQG